MRYIKNEPGFVMGMIKDGVVYVPYAKMSIGKIFRNVIGEYTPDELRGIDERGDLKWKEATADDMDEIGI